MGTLVLKAHGFSIQIRMFATLIRFEARKLDSGYILKQNVGIAFYFSV